MDYLVGALAIVAAGLYIFGSAVMQKGIFKCDEKLSLPGSHGNHAFALVSTPLFVLGIMIEVVGFGLHSVALGLGSLALISILQTSEVLFMLPASRWASGTKLQRQEFLGAFIVLVGLLGTIIFGRTKAGIDDPSADALGATVLVSWLVAVLFAVIGQSKLRVKALLFGVASGVLFGLVAAITKVVVDQILIDGLGPVLRDWPIWTIVASGFAAAVMQVLALGAGKLSTALAAIIVATPIASILMSVTIFQEEFLAHGVGWVLLLASYGLCVFGVIILARSPAMAAMQTDSKKVVEPRPG